MQENLQNAVEIKYISHGVFHEMLRFMYAGGVCNIEKITENLFIAADKYALDELTAACVNCLCILQ